MRRDNIGKNDWIGLGWNGPTFDYDDLTKMRLGDEYTNNVEGGAIILRVTGIKIAATTQLFIQLENHLYDRYGIKWGEVILEKYVVEK